MRESLNIAVFGSGRGSNFQAVLHAIQKGEIPNSAIRIVISNNSGAGILEIARAHRIPAEHLSEKKLGGEKAFIDRILQRLKDGKISLILLAGYMKKVPAEVIAAYRGRIINIHPALLPKYGGAGMYGMHVHEAVIAARDRFSGATVHVVDEEYDRGPILLQEQVAVAEDDTPESLAQKVLTLEHRILPKAIRMIAEGQVTIHTHVVT